MMDDLNVIDRFLETFILYIDSGFGLLGGDVAFLTRVLIGIDITLAGLFWALGGENDVIAKLLRKILYVGAFAFILGNFDTLAGIIFESFAGLGLTAGGGSITAADLLRPGRLAGTGFEAAAPLLDQVSDLLGFASFFDNFLQIAVLMLAWGLVLAAFFILAVQMFVTILEFKLTALAGFVLVPFALWNRTAFLAERVLGNVVASGIKVMVLGTIVGIGTGIFAEFTSAFAGREPTIEDAMSLVLASLALFGLGIFGPGIAAGLVSGGPQLGAGAAIGTVAGAAGGAVLAGGALAGTARAAAAGTLGAVRAGTSIGAAAHTAYALGRETGEKPTIGAGLKTVAGAAANALGHRAANAAGLGTAVSEGRLAAWHALTGGKTSASASPEPAPRWAQALRAEQTQRHRRHIAIQALHDGDRAGGSLVPDIRERDD
jgi:type IV secretion system protein TrbL